MTSRYHRSTGSARCFLGLNISYYGSMEKADLDKRFTSHAPDASKAELCSAVRNATRVAADVINTVVPEGREKSLAIKALEDAMFWGNAGIARHVDPEPEGA